MRLSLRHVFLRLVAFATQIQITAFPYSSPDPVEDEREWGHTRHKSS
jgi:hypothetical protein